MNILISCTVGAMLGWLIGKAIAEEDITSIIMGVSILIIWIVYIFRGGLS